MRRPRLLFYRFVLWVCPDNWENIPALREDQQAEVNFMFGVGVILFTTMGLIVGLVMGFIFGRGSL